MFSILFCLKFAQFITPLRGTLNKDYFCLFYFVYVVQLKIIVQQIFPCIFFVHKFEYCNASSDFHLMYLLGNTCTVNAAVLIGSLKFVDKGKHKVDWFAITVYAHNKSFTFEAKWRLN